MQSSGVGGQLGQTKLKEVGQAITQSHSKQASEQVNEICSQKANKPLRTYSKRHQQEGDSFPEEPGGMPSPRYKINKRALLYEEYGLVETHPRLLETYHQRTITTCIFLLSE